MALSVEGIDTEFERLLDAIFGADTMKAFRRKRPADWICLLVAFESRKRAANPQSPTPLNIPLPFSFIDFYRKHTVYTLGVLSLAAFVRINLGKIWGGTVSQNEGSPFPRGSGVNPQKLMIF